MTGISGRQLATDAAWSLAIKLFGATSNLLVMICLVRLLSSEDMGIFLIAQSLSILIAMLCRFGMKQPVVKLMAEALAKNETNQLKPILRSILMIVAICSLSMALFMLIGGAELIFTNIFVYESIYDLSWLWFALVLLKSFQTPLAEAFRGLHYVRDAMLFDGPLCNFLFLLVLLILTLFSISIDFKYALIIYFVCSAVNLSISARKLHQYLCQYTFGNKRYPLKTVAKLGLPVLVVNSTTYLVSQSGIWICGAFLAAESTAYFGSALRLMLLVSLPLFVLNMVIQSRIVSLFQLGKKAILEQTVRKATTLATLASLVGASVILIWPDEIMGLLFGEEYKAASVVLSVLTIGQVVNVMVGPCLNFMLLVGRRGLATVIVIISGAIAIVLSMFLVDSFGINGVAVGGAIGMSIQNISLYLAAKNFSGISTSTYISPSKVYEALLSSARLFGYQK